jgi:membrane-associated protein
VARIRSWPSWAMPLVVIAAALPGIPAPAVFAVAGLGGMRLAAFLVYDAIGAALVAGLVAGLGYGAGQHAVDVVLAIDRYALWITLALVVLVSLRAGRRGYREDREKKQREADGAPAETSEREVSG